MDVNDYAYRLNERVALEAFASNRASTGCSYKSLGYWPGISLRSFTGSVCLRFFAIAVRSLMLIVSTASENAMAK